MKIHEALKMQEQGFNPAVQFTESPDEANIAIFQ